MAALSAAVGTGIALRAAGLGMRYGGLEVLRGIDLDVRDGEFLCILGPSGCGKSTLLNILAGFLKPTSGTVEAAAGAPVTGPDPSRIFVFQERGTFPWLTVEGNIAFGLAQLPARERADRVRHYVEAVGLRGFEKTYPGELSGGMRQRLEVARALAVKPAMLLLDEPFGALDGITRMGMRRELLRVRDAKTILFITHDIDEAVQLADRVVILSARPATIQAIVPVPLAHPRDLSSPEYLRVRDGIMERVGLGRAV